jgi:hypothetical protein
VESLVNVMVTIPVRILQLAQGYKHCRNSVSPPFDIDHYEQRIQQMYVFSLSRHNNLGCSPNTIKDQATKAMHKIRPIGTSEPKAPSAQTILIAAHALAAFLEAGFKVKGTVRSEQTADRVKKTHAKYTQNLSFTVVPDIRTKGAVDDTVKGVDGGSHGISFRHVRL